MYISTPIWLYTVTHHTIMCTCSYTEANRVINRAYRSRGESEIVEEFHDLTAYSIQQFIRLVYRH